MQRGNTLVNEHTRPRDKWEALAAAAVCPDGGSLCLWFLSLHVTGQHPDSGKPGSIWASLSNQSEQRQLSKTSAVQMCARKLLRNTFI